MILSGDLTLLRTKYFFTGQTFSNLCFANTFPKKVHLRISHFIHSHKIFDNHLDLNSLQVNVETFILTIYEKNIKHMPISKHRFFTTKCLNEFIDII